MYKRGIYGMIILLFLLLFSGCGSRKVESNQDIIKSSKDHIYKMVPLELEGWENGRYEHLIAENGAFYAYGVEYSYTDGESSTLHLAKLDAEGKIEREFLIKNPKNQNLGILQCGTDHCLYGIRNIYPDWEQGESIDVFMLEKFTPEGEKIFSVNLNEVPGIQEIIREQGWFYVGDLFLYKDKVYVKVLNDYFVFDQEGKFQKKLGGDLQANQGGRMVLGRDGSLLYCTYETDGVYLYYLDPEKGTLSGKCKIPGNSSDCFVTRGSGYDVFLVSSVGVFGYNMGDKDKSYLLNYIDSDLNIHTINNIIPINDREFYGSVYDEDISDMQIARFEKVDPAEVKEKQTIVLGCAYLDWQVRRQIIHFNKSSEDYRITIKEYNALYNTENNYQEGINRLNADIVSGRVPDILVLNEEMPFESYIDKGILQDLKEYIDADTELDYNDLMPNVIRAFSAEDRMYQLIPNFYIRTLLAKSSDVGDRQSWTIGEVEQLMQSRPEGTQFLSNISRAAMLNTCLALSGSRFVDWESGECRFDSEEFIDFLHFLKPFPEKIDSSAYSEEYWQNYDSMWRDGKCIALDYSIMNLQDYNFTTKGLFGEPVTIVGFPQAESNGSVIVPVLQIAMSAKSSMKEGAWQFMRGFLMEEYQSEVAYGLPISRKALDDKFEQAMRKPTYLDEFGKEVEYEETYYVNGMEIPIETMTREEAEELKKSLKNFDKPYQNDSNIYMIVSEEAEPFFKGQKEAEDVARIIQSRVQIYVNERK